MKEVRKLLKTHVVLASVVVLLSGGRLVAQFGDGGLPLPCGAECFGTAIEAATACREAGGGFIECAEAFAAELRACREAAGCEGPERPPICGEECLTAARDAVAACREAGGDVAACLGGVRTELRACLEAAGCELPEPPDGAVRCGLACLRESLSAVRDCLQGGGSLRECAGVFRSTFEACRESESCGGGDEPADAEEDAEVLALLIDVPFIRGDANRDGEVNVSDPVAVLNYLFLGQAAPVCLDAADANDDGDIDISDPARTLSSLFLDGGPLPEPYPAAGYDGTEDAMGCNASASD